jgi:hypothetical protein
MQESAGLPIFAIPLGIELTWFPWLLPRGYRRRIMVNMSIGVGLQWGTGIFLSRGFWGSVYIQD